MVDPFRGGGFSTGFGPYKTGGGDFGRYSIGDDGSDVAYMEKYSAEVAWNNGTITDDTYIAALRKYLGTTEKGTTQRVSAENDLDDAIYTIGRNRIVRSVNQAATTDQRIAGLSRLIAYDRRRLSGMVGDNEQTRELRDRIGEAQSQIRDGRYSELIRRFNNGDLSLEAMLAFSRRALAQSRGTPDQEKWAAAITEWQGRIDNEVLADLYQTYEQKPTKANGQAILSHLRGQLGELNPQSPEAQEMQRSIEDLTKRLQSDEIARQDSIMYARQQAGTVSTSEYLTYLRERVTKETPGTSGYRQARTTLLNETFRLGEDRVLDKLETGDIEAGEAIGFYRGYMASMDPGSEKYRDLQKRIDNLTKTGAALLDLWKATPSGIDLSNTGRWSGDLSGQPGGTPVNAAGFVSQFDGSAFASANCWAAVAAMLAWQASDGKIKVSGGDIRYYSGDRDGGGTFEGTATAYAQLGIGLKERHGMGFDAFTRKLLNGQGAILNGAYIDMPAKFNLATNGFTGPHALFVSRAKRENGRTWFYIMDPLGRAGYKGEWVPAEVVKGFGWSNRPNEGGGTWYGDVGFAAKYSSSRTNPDPPFQAFDTDYEGKSTVGRGGGTSREEAGRKRDWSKGRANEPKPAFEGVEDGARPLYQGGKVSIGDVEVDAFLSAVAQRQSMGRGGEGMGWETNAPMRKRARDLLVANGGDARLAALEWFTGKREADTSKWSPTDRFYVNGVATQLGYQSIVPGSTRIITPGKPQTPTAPGTPAPESPNRPGQAVPGIDGTLMGDVAKALLTQLGIVATPDMIRATTSWISVTTGDKVANNNPLGLKSMGQNDLPGQIGTTEDGYAIFGSVEDGIRAAAGEIRAREPGIVAAGRSGDPERFLSRVDRWTPGGYGGALVRTYNELPGDRVLVGGMPRMLNTTPDLAHLSGEHPDVGLLFDIDPRDPAQMGFLQQNIDSADRALESGKSTWEFIGPDGIPVDLPFTPQMVVELKRAKVGFLDAVALTASSPGDRLTKEKAAQTARNDMIGTSTEVGMDEWEGQVANLKRLQDVAASMGDIATYANASLDIADATRAFLGIPPNQPLDVDEALSSLPAGTLTVDDQTKIKRAVDANAPRSIDPTRPETYNPDGDPVLSRLDDPDFFMSQKGPNGRFVQVVPNPLNVVVLQERDASGGVTYRTHTSDTNVDLFRLEPQFDEAGNEIAQVPAYTQSHIMVNAGGASFWTPVTPSVVTGVRMDAYGYRNTVGRGGQAPAPAQGGGLLEGVMDLFGRGAALMPAQGGQFIGGGQAPQAQGGTPAPGYTINDTIPTRLGVGKLDALTVTWKDPSTGLEKQSWSIDGGITWMGGDRSTVANNPPEVVIDTNGDVQVVNGQVLIKGKPWSAETHGPLSNFGHWYGTKPTDGPTTIDGVPSRGARGAYLEYRPGKAAYGGAVMIDDSPATSRDAILESGVTSALALLGAEEQDPDLRARRNYDASRKIRAMENGLTTSTDYQFDTTGLDPAFVGSRTWEPSTPPTARASADSQRYSKLGLGFRSVFDGISRVVASVSSFAEAQRDRQALSMQVVAPGPAAPATGGQNINDARAAVASASADSARKLAEAKAAAARREAQLRAAQQPTVRPSTTQTPTLSPAPRGPSNNGGPGPSPAPRPAPTPAPSPAPKPTPQSEGMY